MDELSVIVSALTEGASKALAQSASDAVRGLYGRLRQAISRRTQENPDSEVVLRSHEKDPTTWDAPLRHTLQAAGASSDAEIVAIAKQLLALVAEEGNSGRTANPVILQSGSGSSAASTVIQGDLHLQGGGTVGISIPQRGAQDENNAR